MQVLLKRSHRRPDVQCSICGQGFRVFWQRTSTAEQTTMRSIILGELRDHHSPEMGGDTAPSAHPDADFNLPDWSGSLKASPPPSRTRGA